MASTGSLSKSVGTLHVASATKLKLTANLIHYGLQVAPPVILPDSGTFEDSVDVTMTCATVGATIHYRLDGQTPTQGDPVYTGPITLVP